MRIKWLTWDDLPNKEVPFLKMVITFCFGFLAYHDHNLRMLNTTISITEDDCMYVHIIFKQVVLSA